MPPENTDVRLALLEQSMEKVIKLLENLTGEIKQSQAMASDLAVLRAEQSRVSQDLAGAQVLDATYRAETNARIERVATEVGLVDAKHMETMHRMWFWQGVAWGAGLLLGACVGVLGFMASTALTDIQNLKSEIRQLRP